MLGGKLGHSLCAVALLASMDLAAGAQTQLAPVHEIDLPVRPSRGTFGGGFWAVGISADETFQFRVAPDQSPLIFYPNTSGQWPLIRLRKWWTATPETEELELPGWTGANTLRELYFRLRSPGYPGRQLCRRPTLSARKNAGTRKNPARAQAQARFTPQQEADTFPSPFAT